VSAIRAFDVASTAPLEEWMQTRPESHAAFVSTGCLPLPETVMALVSEAHQRFQSNTDGRNSSVYPALTKVPSDLFGICVVAETFIEGG